MEVAGRIALVTGAGAGIGEATAMRLAEEGAAVAVADIDDTTGIETAASIEKRGGRAEFVHADVARAEDVRAMVDFARRELGGLDVLVNNAGIVSDRTFPEGEPEDWARVVDVNLRAVMLGTQLGIGAMREQGRGGAIVNVASLAGVGFRPHPDPDYAASKAGVVRLSTALAPLAAEGIRVNCVCPDWVDTPMSRRTRANMTEEELRTVVPPVLLAPDEIADAILELVRDDSVAGRVMACFCGMPRRLLPAD